MTLELVITVLLYVGGALVALLVSWLLALISDELAKQIGKIDTRVDGSIRARSGAFQGRLGTLSDAVRDDAHSIKPSGHLAQLAVVHRKRGADTVRQLLSTERTLEKALDRLDRLGAQLTRLFEDEARRAVAEAEPGEDGDGGGHEVTRAPEAGNAVWLAVLITLTPVVIAVNTFILMEFFGAVFPSAPVLPYPFPPIEIGDIIAVLFSVVEVVAGLLIHASRTRSDRASYIFSVVAPAFMIAALCFVETVAYALLSYNIGMDRNLELDGFLGALVRFFLAPFGAALPLLLAGLGYQLGVRTTAALGGLASRRGERRMQKWYRRIAKIVQDATDAIDNVTVRRSELPVRLPGMPDEGSELDGAGDPQAAPQQGSDEADGADPVPGADEGDASLVEELVTKMQTSPRDDVHPSRAQAWAAVAFDFVLSGALVFFGYAAYQAASFQFGRWLPAGQDNLAVTLAIVLALVVTVAAFVLKEKLSRRMWVGVGLVSVVRMAHLALLGVEALAVLVYTLICTIVRFGLFLVDHSVQLAAVPGKVIDARRRRGRDE